MNGFRVTILVLFSLTVALMFYAVTVVIPGRQEQYELYRTMQKSSEYQQRNAEHRARMEQLGPDAEAPEVANARSEAEESERQRRQELNDAEESSVLAAARRKEEERAAREAAEQLAAPATIGRVTSYSAEWNSILFTPEGNMPIHDGLAIAVSRGKGMVCEAVVDGRDEESGQVSATVKAVNLKGMGDFSKLTPAAGDTVILSPFAETEAQVPAEESFGAALRQMEAGNMTQQIQQTAETVQGAAEAVKQAVDTVKDAADAVKAAATDEGMPALEPIPADDDDMPAEGEAPSASPAQQAPLPSFPTTENTKGLPEVEATLVPIP